ncbi:unnamed protein product [Leptosia nina]|uniref:Uncharacterized protein n=1 Tax=Leptosia nina TaxID=320188 RepID=A0AAV1JD34_9NEOP
MTIWERQRRGRLYCDSFLAQKGVNGVDTELGRLADIREKECRCGGAESEQTRPRRGRERRVRRLSGSRADEGRRWQPAEYRPPPLLISRVSNERASRGSLPMKEQSRFHITVELRENQMILDNMRHVLLARDSCLPPASRPDLWPNK